MKETRKRGKEQFLTHGQKPAVLGSYRGMFSKMFSLRYLETEREYYFGSQHAAHAFYNARRDEK